MSCIYSTYACIGYDPVGCYLEKKKQDHPSVDMVIGDLPSCQGRLPQRIHTPIFVSRYPSPTGSYYSIFMNILKKILKLFI